jgi:hypothetical protein
VIESASGITDSKRSQLRRMTVNKTDPILAESTASHAYFYRVQWVGSMIAGACFGVLVAAVPGKPGEAAARAGMGVVAALFFFGGLYVRSWVNKSLAVITDLLVNRPQDIKNPTLVVMRRNGSPIAWAIDVTDKDGKTYRLRVQTEAKAKQLLAGALR